ncbi:hypothetical protein BQ9231_00294 [Cedratvirus lausannensis]|uniref:Uncharacterized protein n=1 Tax=Cedratvirus lausannensis TaxID=2023205 RepID=A0A285PY64_9VIRU|nr:hypothetical protein BQ9231_00294 [Cedratvirus lausannensis]
MTALRDLSDSMSEDPLLFSSWLNAILDFLEDKELPEGVYETTREIIQTNMKAGMYRFFSQDMQPSQDEVKSWLDKIRGSEE